MDIFFLLFLVVLVTGTPPPVIILPGYTTSTIEFIRFRNTHSPICPLNTNWKQMWPPTLFEMLLKHGDCFLDAMTVILDESNSSQPFINNKNTRTRVLDFGGFDGMPGFDDYVVKNFTSRGWVLNETLFGAPFDWRYPGCGLLSYFADLKHLVEQVSKRNGGSKVNLYSLSYGTTVGYSFLSRMSLQWKTTYIATWANDSPVFSGTPAAILFSVTGLNFSTLASLEFYRDVAIAYPSTLWLWPVAGTDNYTFHSDEPLVTTPTQSYSAYTLSDILPALGLDAAAASYSYLLKNSELSTFEAPLVDTIVTYGTEIPTLESFQYAADFKPNTYPGSPINATFTSGDGLVTERSSLRGMVWAAAQGQLGKQLIHRGFPGQEHALCFVDLTCFDWVISYFHN